MKTKASMHGVERTKAKRRPNLNFYHKLKFYRKISPYCEIIKVIRTRNVQREIQKQLLKNFILVE